MPPGDPSDDNSNDTFNALKAFGGNPEQLRKLADAMRAENRRRANAANGANASDGPEAGGDFSVWPENWHAVCVFCALQTQWRVSVGMSVHWLGLDYAAIDRVAPKIRHAGDGWQSEWMPDDARLFEQLQTLERAALPLLNKPAK